MVLQLRSAAFETGGRIPVKYTGDGKDVSPPLEWSTLPEKTESVALVCDDPDAPTAEPWVHWVIFNVPVRENRLPEGVSRSPRPEEAPGAVQGTNDFGTVGYGGPAPPRGHGTHHYHFRVFALDSTLKVTGAVNKKKLLQAMEGHVLDSGELIATYSR